MTPPLWLKLWIDMLDDAKVAKMSDWQFRKFINSMLVAKECDKDGLLPSIQELAWRLRESEKQITKALTDLSSYGVVRFDAHTGTWLIVNFKKRQMVSDSVDRVRRYRERQKVKDCNAVTPPVSSSSVLNIFSIYESEIGFITKNMSEVLSEAEKEYPSEWIAPAFAEAAKHNARNWSYVEAILKNWKANGFQARKNGNGKSSEPDIFEAKLAQLRAEGKA
jgi:DnaD/phage-associated family protein